MPWQPGDAKKHTKKADTPNEQRKWSATANAVLKRTGDEGQAIRIANARVTPGTSRSGLGQINGPG